MKFKKWTHVGDQDVDETTQKLFSPFVRECRAFGRLCDMHQNGSWAVKCHGWMYLNDTQLASLKAVYNNTNIDIGNITINSNNNRSLLSVCTRWALVKDFIPNETCPADIPTICHNPKIIPKQAWILPDDIEPRNYRGPFFLLIWVLQKPILI